MYRDHNAFMIIIRKTVNLYILVEISDEGVLKDKTLRSLEFLYWFFLTMIKK